MLFKLIKAERLKLKRSPLWLAFLFMPVIPALLGTLNYMANIEILQSEWFSLWTQHTLFTCYFFLPIMIGIYSSYIMRQEGLIDAGVEEPCVYCQTRTSLFYDPFQ